MNIKRCTQSRNFRNEDISRLPATRVFEAVVTGSGLTCPGEMGDRLTLPVDNFVVFFLNKKIITTARPPGS